MQIVAWIFNALLIVTVIYLRKNREKRLLSLLSSIYIIIVICNVFNKTNPFIRFSTLEETFHHSNPNVAITNIYKLDDLTIVKGDMTSYEFYTKDKRGWKVRSSEHISASTDVYLSKNYNYTATVLRIPEKNVVLLVVSKTIEPVDEADQIKMVEDNKDSVFYKTKLLLTRKDLGYYTFIQGAPKDYMITVDGESFAIHLGKQPLLKSIVPFIIPSFLLATIIIVPCLLIIRIIQKKNKYNIAINPKKNRFGESNKQSMLPFDIQFCSKDNMLYFL
ncbi:hypothetical protein V6615_13455 [Oscillospiraceae bacterium PP1C4]